MCNINLPKVCVKVLQKLNDSGFEAYMVGGCIRDFLLNKNPTDYDVTTSATPDEIEVVFSDYVTLPIGKRHGTITVYFDDNLFEITTFRNDGEYFDNRHPQKVSFCKNLKDDLARRDFTINAIAYHPDIGIIDLFGGISDLNNSIIRTIGDGYKRFSEDALRILRAFRFSAELDFRLTSDIYNDILLSANFLKNISSERITMEFTKIIMAQNPQRVERVLNLMCELNVLQQFIPEFRFVKGFDEHCCHQMETLDKHIFSAISISQANLILRLALLFHDIAKPQCQFFDEFRQGYYKENACKSASIALNRMREMKFEKKLIQAVILLVRFSETEIKNERAEIKRWINELTIDGFNLLIKLKMADILATNQVRNNKELKKLHSIFNIANEIVLKKECYTLKQLTINGNDLMRVGIK
ncbi:MAG: polynucleotide adenylyltransferase, partial [Oscillospiraceae bacterium]